MEETAQKLRNSKILNRTLEYKTAVDKTAKPWRCYVKIGNLNVSTTSKMLKGACGARQPRVVKFGENSYSSSVEEIG